MNFLRLLSSKLRVRELPYILILFLVYLAIIVINFPWGKWFLGWDNLLPELNFPANFQRSIFSLWQENEGLGLIGGHGFAANLLHNIFNFILSLIIPLQYIRPVFILFMLLIGSLGCFFLVDKILEDRKDLSLKTALIASLLYMVNFSTIQMFYIPLEAFTVHFAFLPWLLYCIVRVYKNSSRKNILLFTLFSFMSSPQGFIPPLFLIYFLFVTVFCLITIFVRRKLETVKFTAVVIFVTFITNAYWLLPTGFYSLYRSKNYLDSYNNQMTTEDFAYKSIKYGTFNDLVTLKSFISEAVDAQGSGNLFYIFQLWRNHIDTLPVKIIYYFNFIFILSGIYFALRGQNFIQKVFLIFFLISFTFLATDLFPLSFLSDLFRNQIPLFRQAFRIAFTKFSISLSLFYTVFLAIGIVGFLSHIKKKGSRIFDSIVIIGFGIILIYAALPIFEGYLFYNRIKTDLPNDYIQLFAFFERIDKSERIANFPQVIPTGWSIYRWGYSGSGFLWYGLKQPILDRNFDVWSDKNENYYWEISQAIYSRNQKLFENLLEKYQIRWLMVDDNILTYSTAKALYLTQLKEILDYSTKVRLVESFGKIKVYQVDLESKSKEFVFLAEGLPVVGPGYKWNNYDKGFEENGNYITNQQKIPFVRDSLTDMHSGASKSDLSSSTISYNSNPVNSGVDLRGVEPLQSDLTDQIPHRRRPTQNHVYQDNQGAINQVFAADTNSSTPGESLQATPGVSSGFDVYYPFRSLFTGRKQEELEFGIKDNPEYFSFTAQIPKDLAGGKLVLPELVKDEVTEFDTNDLKVTTEKLPEVYLDGELIPTPEVSLALPYIREGNLEIRVPKINGYYSYNLSADAKALADKQPRSCDEFNKGELSRGPTSGQMLRLTSIGSSNCLDFDLPNLAQKLGYLITVENRNLEGKSLLFAVINKNSQRADLETYLPRRSLSEGGQPTTSYFIQPPMEQFGVGYTLHLDNISIGRVKTVNDLGRITVNPIPYRFLTSLKIVTDSSTFKGSTLKGDIKVDHPNPSFYEVQLNPSTIGGVHSATPEVSSSQTNNMTLVLSQSFDSGWKAYGISCPPAGEAGQLSVVSCQLQKVFPFLFAKEIKDHVLVNNWENGWFLQPTTNNLQPTTIILVYLPQYLEYIGFGLLLLIPAIFLRIKK